jgi:hypothetical protein
MNFGGKKRRGKNNLYYQLQEKTINTLIGICRPAHVVHSVVLTAAACLPIDRQSIIKKIYKNLTLFILVRHTSKLNYGIVVNTIHCDSICRYLLPLHVFVS